MNIAYKKILLVFILLCHLPAYAINNHVRIGISSKASTLDPHLSHDGANWTLHTNIYQTLTSRNEVKLHDSLDITGLRKTQSSGIVKNYKLSNNHLQLELEDDITFHDGSALDSKDVIYTIERIKNMADKSDFFKKIIGINHIFSHKKYQLDIEIKEGFGLKEVLEGLAALFIIKEGSGDKPVGSGPFIVTGYTDDFSQIHLKSFADYKGQRPEPALKFASYIYTPDRKLRIQQLIEGKLDILEKITPQDAINIEETGTYRFNSVDSSRFIFLSLDQMRDNSPYVTGLDGKALDSNPLKHPKVRKAISLAIDRQSIVKKVLYGAGTPTGQLLNTTHPHHLKMIKADKYNPKKAKQLLVEAGYPNGFNLTLHSPNNRYIKDEAVATSIANMLTQVGINTTADALPKNIFFKQKSSNKYSFSLAGWSGTDLIYHLKNLVGSYNPDSKYGSFNSSRYSNSKVDQLIQAAVNSTSDAEQISLSQQALLIALKENALIPLYFERQIWVSHPPWSIDISYHSVSQLLNIRIDP